MKNQQIPEFRVLLLAAVFLTAVSTPRLEASPETAAHFDKEGLLQAIDLRISDGESMIVRLENLMTSKGNEIENKISTSEQEIEKKSSELLNVNKALYVLLREETEIPKYMDISTHLFHSQNYLGNLEEKANSYFTTLRMATIFAIHLEISQANKYLEELSRFKKEFMKAKTLEEAKSLIEKMPHYYPAEALYGKPQVTVQDPANEISKIIHTGQNWLTGKELHTQT